MLGHFFLIRPDHKSIYELLQQVIQTLNQQVYVLKLLGFQFRIEHKPGPSNKVADAVSHVLAGWQTCEAEHKSSFLSVFSTPTFDIMH